jgi:hypothetical protein
VKDGRHRGSRSSLDESCFSYTVSIYGNSSLEEKAEEEKEKEKEKEKEESCYRVESNRKGGGRRGTVGPCTKRLLSTAPRIRSGNEICKIRVEYSASTSYCTRMADRVHNEGQSQYIWTGLDGDEFLLRSISLPIPPPLLHRVATGWICGSGKQQAERASSRMSNPPCIYESMNP